MKKNYISLLSFLTLFSYSVFSQTVHVVVDYVYNSSTLIYTLSATTTTTATKVDVSVTLTAETGFNVNNITNVLLYSNTNSRLDGRSTVGAMTGGSGVFTYEHIVATDSPVFYSIRVSSNDDGGFVETAKRSYAAIYLPNAPTQTITHSFASTDLITKVYPSTTDNTVVLEIDISDDDYFQSILTANPFNPAGEGFPIYIKDIYADSDDVASGRVDIGNANVSWGAEGVTYAKITIPSEKINSSGETWLWYKGGRPNFDSSTVGVGIPVYLESYDSMTLGQENVTSEVIGMYPNPSKAEVSVEAEHIIQSIQVNDSKGRTILSKLGAGKNTVSFNVSGQLPGVYLVAIKTKDGQYIKKLLVD